MKTLALSSMLICAALALPGAAIAQSSAPPTRAASAPARPAASAPAPVSPSVRLERTEERMRASPDTGRDSVNSIDKGTAGTQVVPQFSIPFGKTPPQPEGAAPGTGGGIDDSLARCEAQKDAQARARCREQAKSKPPAR
jgi:hypothetical protein